ncbi:hypothetical protein N0V95_005233 [Ascochyta clinopodiicola]|nr:hypothetical protein N0V95_005233 [Ascochyta clinopodiicola]
MRNDPDTPSSDLPSPPTPRDGSSLEVILGSTGTQVLVGTRTAVVAKEEITTGPLYYDYSEEFEREQILEPEVNPIHSGFVNSIRTIHEERGSFQSPDASTFEATCMSKTAIPGIVELPASPVVRRITRDLILQALEPASTTGDVDGTAEAPTSGDDEGLTQYAGPHGTANLTDVKSGVGDQSLDKRFSILSQANSSVVDSSTLEFAVRYSIPIVTGTHVSSDPPPVPDCDAPLSPDTARSTDVDMSDLLAGYQHTESGHDGKTFAKEEVRQPFAETDEDQTAEGKSCHAQKSSDGQSFKSATDVLDSELPESDPEDDEEDAKSYKSATNLVIERESPVKEVDAHSFKTAQDGTTPGRSASMPASKPPPDVFADVQTRRPVSQVPLSSPAPAVLRKPRVPSRDSSFPLANKSRVSSKPSVKQESMSISGSSSTLSVNHQLPPVPPRESSTSKEAQRSMGVASWMLFRRWGKKPSKDEELTLTESSSRETLQGPCRATSAAFSQQSRGNIIKTPEKALCKEAIVPAKEVGTFKDCAPPQVHNASVALPSHHHSFSSPSPAIAEPSSVYSPQDSSLRIRVQSSPAGVPKSAGDRRDSQTTTHLIWHGRKSLNLSVPAASVSEPHLPMPTSSDDTTTDLRLSQYKYPGGLHYLPDLKEESHEDSSLNTSASNLKNSSFRFPFGVPIGVRASVDEGALFSRRSSMGSYRKSVLGPTHGLPSMNFSRLNLFEKLEEELGLRNSRSLDHLALNMPAPAESTPQRPMSAGEMRHKYRSFCDKLDQFNTPKGVDKRVEVTSLLRRALSPELLAEIDQVTVPSVTGLTERLSEFLPSLREYYRLDDQSEFACEEMIMDHAMEDIHEVGGPAQKRSSARLRPIAGSPNMVVIEDALYEELTGKEMGVDVAVTQDDEGEERAHGEARASEKTKDNSSTCPKTPSELDTPSPVATRHRALTTGHQDLRASGELGLTTRSLRSFASTPTRTDTRPWNLDKNYPWATSTVPSVDISLPLPTAVRHSPRPGPSHLRNISDASTVSTFTTPVGSPFGTDPGSSAHARQLHHFSVFGRSGDQPHAVGERYPTSALTPPTAIFRDNFSASDTSDDDTELRVVRKGKFSLKKRFSSARNATLDDATRSTNTKSVAASDNPLELASPNPVHRSATSIIQDTAGEEIAFTSNRHTFRDAEGMPIAIYHRHRLLDHLKRWWHKGGDIIRSFSRRSSTTVIRR